MFPPLTNESCSPGLGGDHEWPVVRLPLKARKAPGNLPDELAVQPRLPSSGLTRESGQGRFCGFYLQARVLRILTLGHVLTDFRERGREGQRGRERWRNIDGLPPIHTPRRDWIGNPGKRPDQESNPQPFGAQDDAPTEPNPARATNYSLRCDPPPSFIFFTSRSSAVSHWTVFPFHFLYQRLPNDAGRRPASQEWLFQL